MSRRQLRARLDRLAPPTSPTAPGQDRQRDRIRRDDLASRKGLHQKLTDREEAELLALEPLFLDEDRDRNRMGELSFNSWRGEGPTEPEVQELAELKRRYPDPRVPFFAERVEAFREAYLRCQSDTDHATRARRSPPAPRRPTE
jgi:hypothetical protein